TPKGRVLVGCRRRGNAVRIEVIDTGLGVPSNKQRTIFEEFQRLEQGAKVARGLGLGLSIVERIARVLNHRVTLHSRPGEGSIFTVEVPVAEDLPEALQPRPETHLQTTPLEGFVALCIEN